MLNDDSISIHHSAFIIHHFLSPVKPPLDHRRGGVGIFFDQGRNLFDHLLGFDGVIVHFYTVEHLVGFTNLAGDIEISADDVDEGSSSTGAAAATGTGADFFHPMEETMNKLTIAKAADGRFPSRDHQGQASSVMKLMRHRSWSWRPTAIISGVS